MRRHMNWMVLSGALLSGMPAAHAGNGFSVGAGTNYSAGNYGTSSTTDILVDAVRGVLSGETLDLRRDRALRAGQWFGQRHSRHRSGRQA